MSSAKDVVRGSALGRAAIAGVRRAQNLVLQARARIRRDATVVYYHRIDGHPRDPWSLSVSPEHFAQHVEELAASGRPLLTFAGMVQALRDDRLPKGAISVTFDDGYADNANVAVPLLEAAGVPATFFVTLDAIDAPGELWWDELDRIFLAEPELPHTFDLEVAGTRLRAELGTEGPVDPAWRNHQTPMSVRAQLFLDVWQQLLTVGVDERDETMAAIAEWSGRSRQARPERRLMTSAELDAMAASPAAEIGSHTFRHPNLTLPNDREREIAGSREALAERLGRPVTTFAYPNGYHDDIAVKTVDAAGYAGACTTEVGFVSGSSPYAVPRHAVPDVDGRAFRRFLRALG